MNKYIVVILLSMLLLSSCSNEYSLENIDQIEINTNTVQKYNRAEVLELELKSPNNMVMLEDKIFIVDTGNDRVLVTDLKGEILQIIGEVGEKEGELINPTTLAIANNGEIIVGDSGNGRIQIFNKDGSFVKKVTIEKFSNSLFNTFKSIVVDNNDNIYVSTDTPDKNYLGVYIISPEDEIVRCSKGLWGNLYSNGESIYLITEGEYDQSEKSFYSEKSHIFRIFPNGAIEPIFAFPKDYTPKSITRNDNAILIYSHGYSTIDRFDFEWNYVDTILSKGFSETTGWKDIIIDQEENIYILNQLENSIIKYIKD